MTGREAKTIHRMLEFSIQKGGFQKDDEHPLNCDLLIVDEASMIDLALMAQLVNALPDETRLIITGDKDQLASVEAGANGGRNAARAPERPAPAVPLPARTQAAQSPLSPPRSLAPPR